MRTIRERFYPHFRSNSIDDWEQRFIALNQLWVISPLTFFESDVLMHLPDIGPQD